MNKVISIIRFLPIILFVDWKDESMQKDLKRWTEINHVQGGKNLQIATLLRKQKAFRNLFIYRNSKRKLFRRWTQLWYRPMNTLFIVPERLGGGCYIQHGFATIITGNIGENAWINQQVTIGYKGEESPTIGNNVMVTCGAKIIGGVSVGDNVTIGANACVVKDIESNVVVGGVPAKVIRRV